jgi:lysylphosphatidylglycerol synthetase-like protein (DUF2156 family)
MRALRLIGLITAYYVGAAAIVAAVIWLFPALEHYLPIGGAEALIASPPLGPEELSKAATSPRVDSLGASVAWLASAIIGAFVTALPVSWVYMGVRNHEDYDQSLVDTILVLPIVVTSIVIIVQHSLALAFSLAGIAAAVRFRNSLKSSGDALFILLAVAVGLSAGIGAIELALLMSVAFNYCFLALWLSNYGERKGMRRRYMEECEPFEEQEPVRQRAGTASSSSGRKSSAASSRRADRPQHR